MFEASNHNIFQAALQIWSAEAWLRFGGDEVACSVTSGAKQDQSEASLVDGATYFLLWFLR